MEKLGKINDSVLGAGINKYVSEELELDQKTIDDLNNVAEAYNMSLDTLVEKILLNAISEVQKISEFKGFDSIVQPLILTDDNGTPKYRITSINY